MKCVNHHRQFFGFFCSDTFLHSTWMRAVWNTTRMQCDHSSGHIFAAHEIAVHIINHFITVNVAVIIWSRNTLRMIIKHTGNKTADNKIICLKSLMYRWRLMHTTGDRLKIMNRECKRVTTSVPPNYIKRVMTIMYMVHASFLFCFNCEVALLVERL